MRRSEITSTQAEEDDAEKQAMVSGLPACAVLEAFFERTRKLLLRLIEYGCKSGEFAAERSEDTADTILLLFEGLKMTNEVMSLEAPVTDRVFRQVRTMLGAAVPEAGRE